MYHLIKRAVTAKPFVAPKASAPNPLTLPHLPQTICISCNNLFLLLHLSRQEFFDALSIRDSLSNDVSTDATSREVSGTCIKRQ